MKKCCFFVIALLCAGYMQAQVVVSYSVSYAPHVMDNMSSLMENISRTSPYSTIGVEIVDNFPERSVHSLNIGYRLKVHEFGLNGSYNSTGGKLSKKDYSGEYSNKFIVNGTRIGFYYKRYFYTYKNAKSNDIFSFFGEVSPGLFFTQVKNRGFFTVQENQLESFDNEYKQTGFSFLIQTGVKYYLVKNINLQIALGYDFASDQKITELKSKNASVNWGGVRFSGGLGISF